VIAGSDHAGCFTHPESAGTSILPIPAGLISNDLQQVRHRQVAPVPLQVLDNEAAVAFVRLRLAAQQAPSSQ